MLILPFMSGGFYSVIQNRTPSLPSQKRKAYLNAMMPKKISSSEFLFRILNPIRTRWCCGTQNKHWPRISAKKKRRLFAIMFLGPFSLPLPPSGRALLLSEARRSPGKRMRFLLQKGHLFQNPCFESYFLSPLTVYWPGDNTME